MNIDIINNREKSSPFSPKEEDLGPITIRGREVRLERRPLTRRAMWARIVDAANTRVALQDEPQHIGPGPVRGMKWETRDEFHLAFGYNAPNLPPSRVSDDQLDRLAEVMAWMRTAIPNDKRAEKIIWALAFGSPREKVAAACRIQRAHVYRIKDAALDRMLNTIKNKVDKGDK